MLMVSNLSRNINTEGLKEIYSTFGVLSNVEIPLDEKNNNLPL